MDNEIIKIRKIGNENVLPLPEKIQPKEHNFRVYVGRDEMIVYVPVRRNPFKDEQFIRAYGNSWQPEASKGPLFRTELPD